MYMKFSAQNYRDRARPGLWYWTRIF
jgi:hypothetical protein